MSMITEIFDRKPYAKTYVALECILRFVEVVDSMSKDSIKQLLIELQAIEPSDDEDEKLIRAAVVYAAYVGTINKPKGEEDEPQSN